ncbi:MAG: hypothetical protein V8R82_12260 [Clostridia bacterium]
MELIEHLLMKLVSFGGIDFFDTIFVPETNTYLNTVLKKERIRFIQTRTNLITKHT